MRRTVPPLRRVDDVSDEDDRGREGNDRAPRAAVIHQPPAESRVVSTVACPHEESVGGVGTTCSASPSR